MNVIKNKCGSLYFSAFSIVLGILGLHSCSENNREEFIDPHYGLFYMGAVTDENGTPLEGEEVIIKIPGGYDKILYFPTATLKTNAAGKYSYYDDYVPMLDTPTTVRVVVIDKDDPEVKDSVDVEPKLISTDRNGWYYGTYLVKGDIKLKKNK